MGWGGGGGGGGGGGQQQLGWEGKGRGCVMHQFSQSNALSQVGQYNIVSFSLYYYCNKDT